MLHYASEMPTDIPWRIIKDITNDFSEERQIGRGGYGAVYKGVHEDGHVVAVKKLYQMPGLDETQFQSEIRNLVGLHHPNIVHLVGKSYLEQDRCVEYNGRLVFATMIDRAICLEYVPNGSLEKHLYDEFSGFSWSTRYKIIKGICKGLEYLHQRRIFHLDLKPANILLDQDMLPKIADFGLSRIFSGTRQSHTTNKFIGTIGYVPPEYIEKGKISEKFDVFSLGVLIIKFLTGPDVYGTHSDLPSEEFIELVHENWRKRLEMDGLKDASYLDALCQQVKTCIEMALNCVQTDRHERPSIRDIIQDLGGTETTLDEIHKQLFVLQPRSRLCFPFELDKLWIEILEQAERRDPQLGEASVYLAMAGDNLRGKLLYLENKVALARILFPTEARVAMDIGLVDGTLEFTLGSTANPPWEIQRTTIDLNDTPYKMKEEHLARMRALSKIVELGKRYFPHCSNVLDKIMDDETELPFFGRDTSVEMKRFQDLQDVLLKAFSEDKSVTGRPIRLPRRHQSEPSESALRRLALKLRRIDDEFSTGLYDD